MELLIHFYNIMLYYNFRCVLPSDDPFRSCFGCEEEPVVNKIRAKKYDYRKYYEFHNFIDRQTGEVFQATAQNRRVVCVRGEQGGMRCRLRIDRAMQLRDAIMTNHPFHIICLHIIKLCQINILIRHSRDSAESPREHLVFILLSGKYLHSIVMTFLTLNFLPQKECAMIIDM